MADTIEIETTDAALIVEFIEDAAEKIQVPETVKQATLRIWAAYCDKYI